jgi:hypothetical protein
VFAPTHQLFGSGFFFSLDLNRHFTGGSNDSTRTRDEQDDAFFD